MKIIITNLPSFYKINLYNRINAKQKLLVLFTGSDGDIRNKDFFRGQMRFDHIFFKGGTYAMIRQTIAILKKQNYSELILSGWDHPVVWAAALCSPRLKNSVVVESSIKESTVRGLKGLAKILFCHRIAKGYVSGKSQALLLDALRFQGNKIITKGVGIFNYIPQPPYEARKAVREFLYVGRLSPEKNLSLLIDVFNNMLDRRLSIIGFGPQEQELKARAGGNVRFLGAIDNRELGKYYQAADVFVLPSVSEPWGLVIEEALNNGVPVIVSDRVGCAEEIISEGKNGLVFRSGDKQSLTNCIERICDTELYNAMRKEISRLDFEEIERRQVACYLD